MTRRPLFWRVFPYYLIIIIAALFMAAYYGGREMSDLHTNQVTETLESRARVASRLLEPMITNPRQSELIAECKHIASASGTRITVVDAQGVVLGDSHELPGAMDNHGSRPEIKQALAGGIGVKQRYSSTIKTNMLYVAVPIVSNGRLAAVVRAAVPVSEVEAVVSAYYRNIALGGLFIAIVAALISIPVLRRITSPLRDLRNAAGRFAAGDLDTRLPAHATWEIADLSDSMNTMAEQLDRRIRTIARQSSESEAILSSMSEGLLALDANEQIVLLNRVAAELFGLNIELARGKPYYEAIRSPAVIELVDDARNNLGTAEMEIIVPGTPERTLQARAGSLKDASGAVVGLVVVFNDISRLKKLEHMRRDFVANVSHELRTPITAITGSVETLMDGAIHDADSGPRFLGMIARHSERLNRLIEDLLSLAKIETLGQQGWATMSPEVLSEVIDASVLACIERSQARHITVSSSCDASLKLPMNRGHIEQALTNLIDNAIKYSTEGATVEVTASATTDEVSIQVRDRGAGIESRHLPRLFERFYRVDEARSREVGGTGLGLAIVKHIAVTHGGRVSVQSTPGKGSTFKIHLPRSA